VDSDIPIYALYFEDKINTAMYVKMGVKDKRRVIDITNIALEIGRDCCHALPDYTHSPVTTIQVLFTACVRLKHSR